MSNVIKIDLTGNEASTFKALDCWSIKLRICIFFLLFSSQEHPPPTMGYMLSPQHTGSKTSLAVTIHESVGNNSLSGSSWASFCPRKHGNVRRVPYGGARETSRDEMCRWLSPQGIVTPLWIPGVWVMVTFHLAEMTVEHIIHSMHLRVGCLIETCTLSPTSTHGTVDTIPGLSRGEKDDVTPQYGPYGCRSGVTMAPAISMAVTFSLIPI